MTLYGSCRSVSFLTFPVPIILRVQWPYNWAIRYSLYFKIKTFPNHLHPLWLSDSQNSLSHYTIHPLVHEIQEWLFYLYAHQKSVCFCCIPNHAGISGNEHVDSLVHSATILTCHPSSMTSQIINIMQLSYPSLLCRTHVTTTGSKRLHLHDYV